MKKMKFLILLLALINGVGFGQNKPFDRLDFLIGEWIGTGSGFGNEKSQIESEFNYIMEGKYIEILNDSKFNPTKTKPDGEHHIDKGLISFDENRKLIVYRQFHIEGYINQYVLNDSLSNDTVLVFETETIESFVPGGKARWTIKKIANEQIETIFDVSLPGKEYACYGTNVLRRKK